MWRTINGKPVCANPEEDITEMQSSLCVHDGMPLMCKQKATAFFKCFCNQEPHFALFCKNMPSFVGIGLRAIFIPLCSHPEWK